MNEFERLGYAVIITAEHANQLINAAPNDFPVHVGRAEHDLERIEGRFGAVRVLYQDDFGGLFDLTTKWTKPQRELAIDWFTVPEGIQIATAVIRVYQTPAGWRSDLAQWNMATRSVRQWTRPGWFRCHVCAKRTRRHDPDARTTITGIFCGTCWDKYGEQLDKIIPEGGKHERRDYACTS